MRVFRDPLSSQALFAPMDSRASRGRKSGSGPMSRGAGGQGLAAGPSRKSVTAAFMATQGQGLGASQGNTYTIDG